MSYASMFGAFGQDEITVGRSLTRFPIAERARLAERGYDVGSLPAPPRSASTFTAAPIEGGEGLEILYYDAAGRPVAGRTDTVWRDSGAAPPSQPATTDKPGVLDTVKSWFQPKSGRPSAGKGAPRQAPQPGMPMPMPQPAPSVPAWVAPAAIATVVLVAATGLYLASRPKRRRPVAANRSRKRRRRRRRRR